MALIALLFAYSNSHCAGQVTHTEQIVRSAFGFESASGPLPFETPQTTLRVSDVEPHSAFRQCGQSYGISITDRHEADRQANHFSALAEQSPEHR